MNATLKITVPQFKIVFDSQRVIKVPLVVEKNDIILFKVSAFFLHLKCNYRAPRGQKTFMIEKYLFGLIVH